jgi:DNA-directed RNA polymerase specialized sigma24 family protein
MPAEPGPEWILFSAGERSRSNVDGELVAAACSAWPKVLAHAHKELLRHGIYSDETSLVTEIWEGVLQSVSQTLQRLKGRREKISDLEAYLLGTFYHRFSRAVRKEQRREETISLVSSVQDLEILSTASQADPGQDLEGTIHAKEIIERMDSWSREVWVAREYGYSWQDIGRRFGMPGHRVMLRFRRRMKILRERLSRGS